MTKKVTLVLSAVAAAALVGCQSDSGSSDSSSTTPPTTTTSSAGPGAPTGGMTPPTMPVGQPAAGQPGKGVAQVKQKNSWEMVEARLNVAPAGATQAATAAGAGMQVASAKPPRVQEGLLPISRKDPFESLFKPIVQIEPATNFVVNHRTASMPKIGPPAPLLTGNPDIDLPPLPPVPRRVAGVMYNGAITAILETGNAPDSEVTVIQPGATVPSGIPGVKDLTVESITMTNLILRATDGRTVEVKLSGLPPSVAEALRQQFNQGQAGGGFTPGRPGGLPGGGGGIPGGPVGGGKGGDL